MEYPVTWWEQTNRERLWLRRYTFSDTIKCTSTGYYCNAMFDFGEDDIVYGEDGYIESREDRKPPKDDPRWPKNCEACGRAFEDSDPFQLFTSTIYECKATGQRSILKEVPIGACWNAWWIADRREKQEPGVGAMLGPDRRSLVVRLPHGHDWHIDNRAKNCTMPDDNTHFCWVRHGRPEDSNLHVDKNGHTCAAGAGSIATDKFHGFLHHNVLRDC